MKIIKRDTETEICECGNETRVVNGVCGDCEMKLIIKEDMTRDLNESETTYEFLDE